MSYSLRYLWTSRVTSVSLCMCTSRFWHSGKILSKYQKNCYQKTIIEKVYWYNITLYIIYISQIWIKHVNAVYLSKLVKKHLCKVYKVYEMEDLIWIKAQCSWWTSRFEMRRVTEVKRLHSVSEMPCTMKNHRTILKINNNEWPRSYIIKYTDQVHQWNSYKQVLQCLILQQLTIHLKKK